MNYLSSSSSPEPRPQTNGGGGREATGFASAAKRFYDALLSACGLVVLSPLFLLIAALVKIADGGGIFYRQVRVGLHGKPFFIWKFRTMVPGADQAGPLVTSDGDARVTRLGRVLRKTKLDELPQLWNVLKGEMSLVGPRPEVPKYVSRYTAEQRNILNLKPGITDLASVHFRSEEELLQNADNLEAFYLQHCLPRKLELNLEYAKRANLFSDTWIILQTVCPYWIGVLSLYSLVLAASFWLSCQLVYDFALRVREVQDLVGTLVAVVAVQLGSLIWRKQCKGLLSYFSFPELKQIATALGFSCLLLLVLRVLTHQGWPPRNLILVDSLVAFCALSGLRLGVRLWRENASVEDDASSAPPLRVGIIGAGSVGSQLACELIYRKQLGRAVVAFFDDDEQKWHRHIHDIPIIGMPECLLEGWGEKLDEVIVALPNAPVSRIHEIDELVHRAGFPAYRAPSVFNLWPGSDRGTSKDLLS